MRSKLALAVVVSLLSGCSACESKLTLPDEDASTSEQSGSSGASGGGPGASDGGGTGASSGGDSGLGVDAGPAAPGPVEIDRSGLIPTSGSQLLLHVTDDLNSGIGRLVGLDLETGELHELMNEPSQLSLPSTSPDGRTLVFGSSISVRRPLFVAHVLDEGLVPATPVEGTEAFDASYFLDDWSADGRFGACVRSSSVDQSGVVLVDAWRHRLHWSANAPPKRTGGASISPNSVWLSFMVGISGTTEPPTRSGFGRITDDGVDVIEVASMWHAAIFSADSTRAFYRMNVDGAYPTQYRDLIEGESAEVVAEAAGDLAFTALYNYSIDADHALAWFYAEDGRYSFRHLALSDGASVEIGEPGHEKTDVALFASGNEFIVLYEDEPSYEIALVDPRGAWPHETIETLSTDEVVDVTYAAYGARHARYEGSANPRLEIITEPHPESIRLVARGDDGVPQLAVVSEPDELAELCDEPIAGHGALLLDDGSMALLDLRSALARRLPAIQPQHGGGMSCPIWNADGSAFAVTERLQLPDGGDQTWIHLGRWSQGDDGPGELQLVHQADAAVQVLVTRP